jgi:hypothetical protein
LIFQSPDGVISKIKTNEFGFTKIDGEENERSSIEKESSKENTKETIANDGQASIADQNTLASSERRSTENGTSDRDDYVRILDGKTVENGSSESFEHTDTEVMADVATSFERNASWSSKTTNSEEERYESESRIRCESITEKNSGARENDRDAGSIDCNHERDAGIEASKRTENSKEGEENWREEKDTKTSSKERSVFGFWKKDDE